jgi:hypothetical protein
MALNFETTEALSMPPERTWQSTNVTLTIEPESGGERNESLGTSQQQEPTDAQLLRHSLPQVLRNRRPEAAPARQLRLAHRGSAALRQVEKQQTDFVEFTCRVLQAREDVDQTALQEAGGGVGKTRRLTFWLTDDAVYR